MKIFQTGLFYWWVAVIAVVLDQITKWLIVENIPYQGTVNIFSWFSLVYVHNTGAAFSFLAGAGGWQTYLFLAIAVVAVVIIGVCLYRSKRSQILYGVSLSFIAGGAVGNVIDRVCYDHVIDFILVYVKGLFTYPAFNIADSFICVGVFLLIVEAIFFDKKKGEQKRD